MLQSAPMLPLAEWQTFLAVEAGAAATLTGLVFVAVSINLDRIMAVPGLPGRASDSLLQLLQVFFVSGLGLVPRQPPAILAGEVLAISVASWLCQVIGQIRYGKSRHGQPLEWLATRVILGQSSTAPLCLAGILLMLGKPSGLYWLAAGFVFSFVAGVLSAWVLLVEILR